MHDDPQVGKMIGHVGHVGLVAKSKTTGRFGRLGLDLERGAKRPSDFGRFGLALQGRQRRVISGSLVILKASDIYQLHN